MISLQKETIVLLEDLEKRLDATIEDDFSLQWEDFLLNRFEGNVFTPHRKKITQPSITLPNIHINDAINNVELMLCSQLVIAAQALSSQTLSPCIRANYGTGILSSLFGAELYIMPREMNTLPTTRAFNNTDKICALLEKGIPSLTNGLGQRVFEFGEFCAEVFQNYPLVSKYVEIYQPDLQGPLDLAELMWGTELFYAMYDEPELVHDFLALIRDTYINFLEKWDNLIPSDSQIHCQGPYFRHSGHILLRNDSAMNLSPQLYEEFSVPYDASLLAHFKGGAVHFCGRGDHYIEALSSIPALTAINMTQPELNNMDIIYRHTVDKGIKLLSLSRDFSEADFMRPGGFHHNVHSH